MTVVSVGMAGVGVARAGTVSSQTLPQLVVGTGQGHPQLVVRVTGSGFAPRTVVSVRFDKVRVASARTGPGGRFQTWLKVPAQAQPGRHIVAANPNTGKTVRVPFVVRTNWVMDNFDARRTGVNPWENTLSAANVSQATVQWTAAFQGLTDYTSAVTDDGMVFAAAENFDAPGHDTLIAYNANTGAQIWATGIGTESDAPVVTGGLVYACNGDQLNVLDEATGALQWLQNGVCSPGMIYSDGVLYFGTAVGMGAFDIATRQVLWNETVPGGVGGWALANGTLYLSSGQEIQAYDASNGQLIWSTPVANVAEGFPSVADGMVFAGDDGNDFYALDATTGAIVWHQTVVNPSKAPAVVNDGTVYIDGSDGVSALSATSGQIVWQDTTLGGGPEESAGALANGVLYMPTHGAISALDAATGDILWQGGSDSSSVVVTNGNLYAATSQGLTDFAVSN